MKYFFISIILFSFCSCSIKRRIYSSTQINNPSLQQKNDHSFSLAYSRPSGFDFTGGYAITNRLAIIGGAYAHKNKDNEEDFSIGSSSTRSASAFLLYRHKGFHAGLGIYFPFSKKNNRSFGSFFGGYTKGDFRMDERYSENTTTFPPPPTKISFYKSNISRYFLQGGVSFYGKAVEMAITGRYNYVAYSNVSTDYTTTDQYNSNLPLLGYPKFSQFLDLGFDSKFFFTKKSRIGLQIFVSTTTRLNKKEFNFYYYPFRGGIGVVIKNPFKKNN
jgi:hypothetical protein